MPQGSHDALENVKWFFVDPSRVLAFLTFLLVVVGISALCIQRDAEERQLRAYMLIDPTAVHDFAANAAPQAGVK